MASENANGEVSPALAHFRYQDFDLNILAVEKRENERRIEKNSLFIRSMNVLSENGWCDKNMR